MWSPGWSRHPCPVSADEVAGGSARRGSAGRRATTRGRPYETGGPATPSSRATKSSNQQPRLGTAQSPKGDFVAAGHLARGFNAGASHAHYVYHSHPHLRDLRPLFARQPLWYACADAAAREDWEIPRALPSLRSPRSPDFSPAATCKVSF